MKDKRVANNKGVINSSGSLVSSGLLLCPRRTLVRPYVIDYYGCRLENGC